MAIDLRAESRLIAEGIFSNSTITRSFRHICLGGRRSYNFLVEFWGRVVTVCDQGASDLDNAT